jgi:hypothetical protein
MTRKTIYTIEPLGMTFSAWADAVVGANDAVLSAPKSFEEHDWQEWAAHLAAPNYQIPSPYGYATWLSWANALNQALSASAS